MKRADARSKGYIATYGEECWELDAVPPDELQRLVTQAIEFHIVPELWRRRLGQIEDERVRAKGLLDKILGESWMKQE